SANGGEGSAGTDTSTNSPTTGSTGASTAPTSGTTDGATTDVVEPSPTSSSGVTTGAVGSTSTGDGTTDGTGSSGATSGGEEPSLSFFVSSTGSATGNLGGLDGADKRCQDLAAAVGAGGKTWRAYLSVEKGPDDQPVHAKDR